MKFSRTSILVASLAALTFVASVAGVGLILSRRLKENPPRNFAFKEVDQVTFKYAGRDVTLQDVWKDQTPYLRVHYGDEVLDLAVTIPSQVENLPGLAKHNDWLRVLRFADATGLTFPEMQAKIDAGEVRDRLAIVTKVPRAGADVHTYGEVWKRDWHFGFYEFKPEGGWEKQVLGYPRAKMGHAPKEGELAEGTWQFNAALHLMPKEGPVLRFQRSALSEIPWPMFVAVGSTLVFFGAIVAGYRRGRVAG